MNKRKALYLGKFLPFHNGHKFVADFGLENYDELVILIDDFKEDLYQNYISKLDRQKIIKSEYKDNNRLTVDVVTKQMPQEPSECENFWNIWIEELNKHLEGVTHILGSEDYIKEIAFRTNRKYLILDKERNFCSVQARDIRETIYSYWFTLPNSTKKYYQKNIAIVGPESTGKSTLLETIFNYYRHGESSYVPEFAINYIGEGRELKYEDMEEIARGQYSLAQKYLNIGKMYNFMDTDIITTKIWSKFMFGKYPSIIDDLISKLRIDLYILTDVDKIPFKEEIYRYYPDKEDRKKFQDMFNKEIESSGIPFIKYNYKDDGEELSKKMEKILF